MSTAEQIKINANWLLKHGAYWQGEMSQGLSSMCSKVAAVEIPAGTLDFPGFKDFATQYTKVAQGIHDFYKSGVDKAIKTGELLALGGRSYIDFETEAEAEVRSQILGELGLE